MKKFLACSLLLILLVGGCGAAKSGQSAGMNSAQVKPSTSEQVQASNDSGMASKPNSPEQPGSEAYPRKVIQNRNMLLQVENVRNSIAEIERQVQSLGGFVAGLNLNDGDQVTADMVLRVPVQGADQFNQFLAGLGSIRSDNLQTEDITGQFYDAQARLNNAQAQEKRLVELMNQAKSMDDILKIEAEISKVREQIEVLQGQINRWNDQVELATIHISVQPKDQVGSALPWEPLGITAALAGAKNGILVTLKAFYNLVSWIVVFIGYLLPVLIIAIPAGYLVWRKRRKQRGTAN